MFEFQILALVNAPEPEITPEDVLSLPSPAVKVFELAIINVTCTFN